MPPEDLLPEDIPSSPPETVLEALPSFAISEPAREPFWGYSDLAMVMGLLFASIVLLLVVAGLFISAKPALKTDPVFLLTTQFGLYIFVYLCFWVTFKTRYDRPVFSSLGWRPSTFSPIWAVICGVALAILLSAFGSLIHTPKDVKSPLDDLTSTPGMLALFGLMAVTVAPLFEEMFFRGFVQPLLSRSLGTVAGIGITAAIFGALHAPEYAYAWQYAVCIALAGAAFGWVRARTNSIIPGTIMHGAFNLASVVAMATKYAPHS